MRALVALGLSAVQVGAVVTGTLLGSAALHPAAGQRPAHPDRPHAPPLGAGWLLERSSFRWPLVLGARLKIAYDLLLLAMFRDVKPPEER